MATKTVSKNINSLIEAVNTIFAGLIEEIASTASRGKIKVDDIKTAMEDSKFQFALMELIKEKMPKAVRTREKKLKDPEAPKRPKSSYLFFCDAKRSEVKEANAEMKATEISTQLGALWQALSEHKKKKYVSKAEVAKGEYKEAMVGYERPSDEDLAKLDVNQRRRGSKGEGKTKKKKDPNAPKRPTTSFLLFSQDNRAEVKEANKEMKAIEISVELGRMWKEDFADEESRKKWVNAAAKAKERYEEEMKEYTPPAKSEDESDTSAPKKKRGRPSKSKLAEETTAKPVTKGKSNEEPVAKPAKEIKPKAVAKPVKGKVVDSDDEEEPVAKPAKEIKPKAAAKPVKGKSKEVVDSDDEEEPVAKPVTKGKSKEEPVAKPVTKGKVVDSDDEEEPVAKPAKEIKPKAAAKPVKGKVVVSDDEEEPVAKPVTKPVTKGKSKEEPVAKSTKLNAKVVMTMGTAKVVATPARASKTVRATKHVEEPTEADLFGDDE